MVFSVALMNGAKILILYTTGSWQDSTKAFLNSFWLYAKFVFAGFFFCFWNYSQSFKLQAKGQEISEWMHEVALLKIWTKKLEKFYPYKYYREELF